MIKRMIIMLIFVAVVLGGVFGWKFYSGMQAMKAMQAAGIPPQTVSTIKAASSDWQPELEAVGTLRAVNGADLSFEVSGLVENLNFKSGDDVEKGVTLAQLVDEDDVAKLAALQATARLAEITYNRDLRQLKAQAVSQATVDADKANLDNANALAVQQQAIVDKKVLRAPFAGHLGIRQVDVGQYLNPGTAVVTLQQLDPIFVDFDLPQQDLTQIKVGQKATVHVDAFSGVDFVGTITAINSLVDPATRNVPVRVTLANPDRKLLPGMFAQVEIDTGAPQSFITLPQTAITFNPYGDTVYIVDTSDSQHLLAKQVFVTEGKTRGDQVAILSGIKEGDEVVTAGQVKLRNGSPVLIDNQVQPLDEPNPKPHEQ